MTYALIDEHRRSYDVVAMCTVLKVSRAGYYAWRKRRAAGHQSARATEDARLLTLVRDAHAESDRTYGAPRVHEELRAQGERVAKKRVARLMRADGLVARPAPRRRPVTTDSDHGQPVAPNLLGRRFGVDQVPGLNRVWIGDITYIPTREGWLYLAVLLDLKSRRVVGWATRANLEATLALDALRWALADRRPAPGLLCHSDQGSQYASNDYQAMLATHGLVCSMSRRGNCYDNAAAESFFATLEHELLTGADFRSRAEARQAIFRYIEGWYNRRRRHSTLGYVSPLQYEQQLAEAQQRAA
jgi:transposase InsO family protein